ncbi:ATP-binding cassette domain-containing protein, partial [bacterium]|nr:ATP-binding cassette domain-containing protein [bacterium]
MPSLIDIKNLTVQFNGTSVLQNFSLAVEAGQKVTISGRSGSGKSTILRCILGFVNPTSGEVSIDGEALSSGSVWKLRRKLAYVAQEPQLGEGTTEEIMQQPFQYKANSHLKQD